MRRAEIEPRQPTQPTATVGHSYAKDDHAVVVSWLRGVTRETQEYYRRGIYNFLRFVGKPIHQIVIDDLWDYHDHLKNSDNAESTVYRKMTVVKSFLTYAFKTGYTKYNVGVGVKIKQPTDTLEERIIDRNKVDAIIEAADNERDRLMLSVMYFGGLRVSEIVGLKWKDLNHKNVLRVVGKRNKLRYVKLPDRIGFELRVFGDVFDDPNLPMFASSRDNSHMSRQNAWEITKKCKRRAGIEKDVSPHWMRHAHVSHALDNGAPPHVVQKSVGHSSLQTTSRYTHMKPDTGSGDWL